MSKDNGGPAFPTVDANRTEDYGTYGMSLRDWFAGRAMQGLLPVANGCDWKEQTATLAYELADLMLAERLK